MKLMTELEFIDKSRKKHNGTIDYSSMKFVNARTPVILKCTIHNEQFIVEPRTHLRGTSCKLCNTRYLDTDVFISKAVKIHGDLYDYSKTIYLNNKTKVIITCPIHGDFVQQTNEHLNGGGCSRCGSKKSADFKRKTAEQFIKEASKVHSDKYLYRNIEYVNYTTPVTIICKDHGEFTQTPSSHLRGSGCLQCVDYNGGFKWYLPGILYYLKVESNGHVAYKIGITNRSIKSRFKVYELEKITVIKVWEYPEGREARKKEKDILKKFKVYRWTGPNLLESGNTELFDRDVLELDIKDNNE